MPATIIFHAAGITDPVNGQEQIGNTLKNPALLGALLKFAADGAGLVALDNRFAKKSPTKGNQLPLETPVTVSA